MDSIIEHLRDKMIQLANEKGNLHDPEVVAVSQRLDLFIVQAQRKRWISQSNFSRRFHFRHGVISSAYNYPTKSLVH